MGGGTPYFQIDQIQGLDHYIEYRSKVDDKMMARAAVCVQGRAGLIQTPSCA